MEASTSWASTPQTAVVATAAAVATASVIVLAKATLWPPRRKVLTSPLAKLRSTPDKDVQKLVYRPDAFPGARDVDTPYGSVRVYEFGPVDGEKVLLVHGISTSCITLGRLAHELVARGCRVMLFDLFGRGFSDGVGDLPHDERLYASQMLCVLASSPLSWTGDGAFRLVGYSLGGGIAVRFANSFPRIVSSLVLLAPAGLIRAESFGRLTRFVFASGLVPERLLAVLTKQRLQKPIAAARVDASKKMRVAEAALAEAETLTADRSALPLEERVLDYVRWMVLNHEGFVPAFMSCIRFAPLTDQHDFWNDLAARDGGTTAMFFAESDELIDAEEYARDGLPRAGGKDKVVWRVLPGSHDFVMTHVSPIMAELDAFWGMTPPA